MCANRLQALQSRKLNSSKIFGSDSMLPFDSKSFYSLNILLPKMVSKIIVSEVLCIFFYFQIKAKRMNKKPI
jgi:hypothetical protein